MKQRVMVSPSGLREGDVLIKFKYQHYHKWSEATRHDKAFRLDGVFWTTGWTQFHQTWRDYEIEVLREVEVPQYANAESAARLREYLLRLVP